MLLDIRIFAAVLFLAGMIRDCPASSIKVSLFLDVVTGNASIVVVLHVAALGCKAVHDDDRHSRMTLAYVLVAVATQSCRVAAKATYVRLQPLHHHHHLCHCHND